MAHERIEIRPEVMSGKPVIRGTRMTVELILRELAGGMTKAEIVDAYPRLTFLDIEAALAFAINHLPGELPAKRQIKFGLAKGKFEMPDDFDADNEIIARMFNGEDVELTNFGVPASYIRGRWIHDFSGEPILIYSELDGQRRELRKVEIFPDGSQGWADESGDNGLSRLSELPIPPVSEINTDPQFKVELISMAEFEAVWRQREVKLTPPA